MLRATGNDMSKLNTNWRSRHLGQSVQVVRWGVSGRPVLLFPTAGGDAEECERFLMLRVLEPLLAAGRVKVYSIDSVAGRAWINKEHSGAYKARVQNRFDAFIYEELVGAIRRDCNSRDIEIITAGASLGAFNALAALCRHPDVFSTAVCMSGTYDFTRWMNGEHTHDFHVSSPLHFLAYMDECAHLERLRTRSVILATGEGKWEDPGESWRVAQLLGRRQVPNRVDLWGERYDHDWVTWRDMLPKYLDQLT